MADRETLEALLLEALEAVDEDEQARAESWAKTAHWRRKHPETLYLDLGERIRRALGLPLMEDPEHRKLFGLPPLGGSDG